MKTIILFFYIIFSSIFVIGQTEFPGILNMYIIPAEPTENDEINLVILSKHTEFPCWLDSANVEIDGNSIQVYTDYYTGWAASICYSLDTIPIGQLSAGHYFLVEYYDHNNFQDTDSLNFFIGMPTEIVEHESPLYEINLFPNPTDGETVQIAFTAQEAAIGDFSIHDLSGRMVYSTSEAIVQGENYISLNYPEISSGMYIVSVGLAEMRYSKKLIVK